MPILEYHAIETPTTGEAFPELFVEPQDFEAQMQWLDDQGFEAVTLDQVEDAWYESGRLPPKPIVVSFDDGYPSQYSSAFAVLEKRDWPGVLNLPAQGSELPDADVQRMLDAGWELASKAITQRRPDDRRLDARWSARWRARGGSCGGASVFRWTTSAIRSAATTPR